MTKEAKKRIINEHLYHELKYLICAAASWQNVNLSKEKKFPLHFIVYTMDSTFLHARTLFEFFTYTNKKSMKTLVCWNNFGISKGLKSQIYNTWREPLHSYVMHLKDRTQGTNEQNREHLKNMPFELAKEIIKLWFEFSQMLDEELQNEMIRIFELSVRDAEKILPQLRNLLKN